MKGIIAVLLALSSLYGSGRYCKLENITKIKLIEKRYCKELYDSLK